MNKILIIVLIFTSSCSNNNNCNKITPLINKRIYVCVSNLVEQENCYKYTYKDLLEYNSYPSFLNIVMDNHSERYCFLNLPDSARISIGIQDRINSFDQYGRYTNSNWMMKEYLHHSLETNDNAIMLNEKQDVFHKDTLEIMEYAIASPKLKGENIYVYKMFGIIDSTIFEFSYSKTTSKLGISKVRQNAIMCKNMLIFK